MKFNINDFSGAGDVMYCQSEEEGFVFTQYLHSLGKKWRGGGSYCDNIQYISGTYPSVGVSYMFNQDVHGAGRIGTSGRFLHFEEFEWDICLDLCPCEEERGLINEFLLSFCKA